MGADGAAQAVELGLLGLRAAPAGGRRPAASVLAGGAILLEDGAPPRPVGLLDDVDRRRLQ
jgi:hypothetical protein